MLLAHYIFEEQRDMNTLLRRVLKKGCEMFNSTGCRILLVENSGASSLGNLIEGPASVSTIDIVYIRLGFVSTRHE